MSRVGEVLASKYRLEAVLGSGGMGEVYRAVNLDVGRAVAIKLLRPELAMSPSVVERFLREARAANLVRHPNVVDVLDVGREANGTPFIVQELLEGEDLAHFIDRRGGKLPLNEVIDILGPVIDAVGEAHAQGVIHRDIKPDNVFLAKVKLTIVPKLLDFGISKVSAPDQLVTEIGVMMGTPAYMPPEQVEGTRAADPRSDVWALGVMLFELIAGRMPFEAPTAPALFYAIAHDDAPTLLEVGANVPPSVSQVVARCLRRLPEDRYPSAAELGRDLRHIANGTDLEPTSKRSTAPSALKGTAAPTFTVQAACVPTISAAVAPRTPTSLLVPELAVSAAPARETPRSLPASEDLGQMHAVVSSRRPARRSQPLELAVQRYEPVLEGSGGDHSGLVGAGVVGAIMVAGIALLMGVLHRPEGWPIAHFLLGPGQTLETPLHLFLALVCVALAGVNAWRGVRHWKGDLDGGPSHGIFNAAVATVALFSAVEVFSALR